MPRLREIVDVAHKFAADLGPDAETIVAARAATLRRAGETDDAAFWDGVAQALRSIGPGAGARRGHPEPPDR